MTTAVIARETKAPPAVVDVVLIPVADIDIGPNVRHDVHGIEELAASILEHGLQQPITVRVQGKRWIVVHGQRRLLAHLHAGIERIPAIVTDRKFTATSLAIAQLVENIHREDMAPLDRARAVKAIVDAGTSQADLARELGFHPSTIANDLRLLTLDEQVQAKVETGEISPTHARTIASLPPKQQRELANRVSAEKLSTHDLEREIKYKQDAAEQDAAKVAKTAKWIPKAIAALEADGIGKAMTVFVRGDYYSMNADAVRDGIAKAGWKVTTDYPREPRPESCDCGTLILTVGGRKAEIRPACSDRRHVDRQVNLEHLAREAAARLEEARAMQLLEATLPPIRTLPAPILRILAFQLQKGSGRYGRWDEFAGHSQTTLAELVAEFIIRARDVDVPAVLRELGVEPAGGPLVEPGRNATVEQIVAHVQASTGGSAS